MSREIPLTKGFVAIVDDEDYEELSKYSWHWQNPDYATRTENGKTVSMHRQILGVAEDIQTDHVNGRGRDNRRSNLRVCTHTQNMYNKRPYKGRRFKGVSHRTTNSFAASIRAEGATHYLGSYPTEEAAARAYDAAARKYHGEFAWLNFPPRKLPDGRVIPIADDATRLAHFMAVPRDWIFMGRKIERVA